MMGCPSVGYGTWSQPTEVRWRGAVPFYLVVGMLLFFAAVVLDITFGLGLLMRLINLKL